MTTDSTSFPTFLWRITAAHMITYFVMGVLALVFLDYARLHETPPLSYLMRPVTAPVVALGPLLQALRGLVLAAALWYFRDNFLLVRYGWLKLWGLIVGLSILSTAGPAPASIEGYIYTKIPVDMQLRGYLEVLPQTLLFSLLVFYWHEQPRRLWNILSVIFVLLIALLCIMGWLAARS